ncbi:MAG: DUF86 domain-containing protein [Anaerolineaceae bacterium]|nr:DUF86 domain-containing protein [Anaerolineaceae bacterium]
MRRDETLLLDRLIAAQKIKTFANDLSWETFRESKLHQSAIIRELQVIGEAARLVTTEMKTLHPEIHWGEISGMRNRLIHEYFRVDLETIWDAVQNNIGDLVERLKPLIPPDPN